MTLLECVIPHGRTARRLEWQHLPRHVRAAIEQRLGSQVLAAASQGGGFSPSFASTLTCADGSQHFVKAASVKAQRNFAESYRQESVTAALLPRELPAPRLRWSFDDGEWVALGYPHHPHHIPARPWQATDLAQALQSLGTIADRLTPPPPQQLPTLAEEIGGFAHIWEQHVLRRHPDLPLGAAAAAAAGDVTALTGETVVHCDVRADNVLLTEAGPLLCDWTWAAVGPPWFDSLCLLIGAHGDGHDAETWVQRLPVFAQAEPAHVTTALALVTAWFWHSGDAPVPTFSPHVREAQAWLAQSGWRWLTQRLTDDLGTRSAR